MIQTNFCGESIYEWAETLEAYAAARDEWAKGAAASLGITLYRSLDLCQMDGKESHPNRQLILGSDGGKKVDQMEVVRRIVNLVASDTAVDRLRRIAGSTKKSTLADKNPLSPFTNTSNDSPDRPHRT